MDQGLKERLIGAAVLVALGVWLIPWLLDGRQEQVELDTSSSAVRLPAPDGPLPVRSQTLSLDAEKSEPLASDPRPDAAEPASTPPAETAVAAVEPTPAAPVHESALKQGAAVAETAPPPKQTPAKPGTDHGTPPRVATAPTPTPTAGSKPAPKAPAPAQATPARSDWAVQLGSFGTEDNAKKLVQKVNVYGYKPEVATIRASGRAMYRVRLGPYRSRAEADATVSALSAHGFSAQVVAAD
jgi:DedD protein